MPRSPIVTKAVRELAKYFQAVTDAAFIDQSYKLIPTGDERAQAVGGNASERIEVNRGIYNRAIDYTEGTEIADHISNVINGSVNFVDFWNRVSNGWEKTVYNEEFKFLRVESTTDGPDQRSPIMVPIVSSADVAGKLSTRPTVNNPNLYVTLVNNPYLGPMTKDTGAVEIFMNGIPTLEFSKCVPYINLEIVSLRKAAGTVAPALTLQGYLNPPTLGSADNAILKGSTTDVRSEVLNLGTGIRSGIELFTTPQTLANLGDTGSEFVPVVDRFRPFASLGNLSLSTKLQGGAMSFTTGKLEITIHERSRLREAAAFVRPDLYGTTFLDITYGWSHPEGGAMSSNSYGKFLDALKTTTRYRISNSSYSFEEGGSVKVTLSIQSVGTIDLLYLGPRKTNPHYIVLQQILRQLNERLAELRFRGTSPSMAEYDIIDTFKDPTSALRAASDDDALKKLRDLASKSKDADIRKYLKDLVGIGGTEVGGNISEVRKALVEPYTTIVSKLPSLEADNFAADFLDQGRFEKMKSTSVVLEGTTAAGETKTSTTDLKAGNDVFDPGQSKTDYVTYGSVFMEMVAKSVASSKQYDEIQVVFYPFNKYAGAVHDLPISSFPIERSRLQKVIKQAAESSPELSARAIIGLLYNDFVHFTPSRAYLMAGFYKAKKDDKTGADMLDFEAVKLEDTYTITTGGTTIRAHANLQLTFEQRLKDAGIPEGTFRMPVIEVAVEAAPLLDADGIPVTDELGNSKTIVKIHVYDSAMDPHSTLTDIIKASKDNELGVVNLPVAQYQSAIQSSRGSAVVDSETKNKYKIVETLGAGLKTGLLEPIGVDGTDMSQLAAGILAGTVCLRIKGGFDEVKKMVTAGMPTIIYGSSATALTTANLTTGGSAGLPNVQLQRAFASPGEAASEDIDTGVPMQILPAQLSIGTIGCPLFSPMQRFFVDFGTGTSIDNVYFVTSVDSNIGRDGYKTDVKMSFGEGFATYRSLNQQLATMAANWNDATKQGQPPSTDPSIEGIDEKVIFLSDLTRSSNELGQLLAAGGILFDKATSDANIRISEALAVQKKRGEAVLAMGVQKQRRLAEAAIPAEVQVKLREIEAETQKGKLALAAASNEAERLAAAAASLEKVNSLAAGLPDYVVALLFDKAAADREQARVQAQKDARDKPKPKPKKEAGKPAAASTNADAKK